MLWVKLTIAILSGLLGGTWTWIFLTRKPNGILKIDEYINKDKYLMMWLTPLPELRKHKRLTLEVKVETHNDISEDDELGKD